MFLRQMNLKIPKYVLIAGLAMTAISCAKGGGSFSVLSQSQSFTQPGGGGGAGSGAYSMRPIDVLIVVDNSQSMVATQQKLADNFPSFIQKFIANGYDFKIAVTTSDAFIGGETPSYGEFLGQCATCTIGKTYFNQGANSPVRVIASSDYNLYSSAEQARLTSDFTSNVLVGVQDGSYTIGKNDPRHLSSMHAALNSSAGGTSPNIGFHRPDAYFAVISVTDQDDKSCLNSNKCNNNHLALSMFQNYLATYTSKTTYDASGTVTGTVSGTVKDDFSASAIAILDSVCDNQITSAGGGTGGAHQISTRLTGLASMTGGSQMSLCADFSLALDGLAGQILSAAKPMYYLDKKAIEASISVIINGVTVPKSTTNGWSYSDNGITGIVTINGTTYKPAVGASVVINFDPLL